MSMYTLQNHVLKGCFEAYQKDSSLSSLLETLTIYCKLLPSLNEPVPEEVKEMPEDKEVVDNEEEEYDEERGSNHMNDKQKDEAKDYDKVKEHMHMVLARYAKEGIIDYKEAAQIHDVLSKFS